MLPRSELTAARELIQAANSICVLGHIRPDADAIGSVTALVSGLTQLGKDTQGFIGQRDSIPKNLLTIPGANSIRLASHLSDFDLAISVDCGSSDRLGALEHDFLDLGESTIVVDHHATNTGFGQVNLIDAEAESNTTVLDEWFTDLGVRLNKDIAHCLYSGLVTDTGSFRWGRPQMHNLAETLINYGLDTREIAAELMDDTSLEDLHVVGKIIAQAKVYPAGPFKFAVLLADYQTIKGQSESVIDGLVDAVRAVDGTQAGAVFKEYCPGVLSVSLRSATLDVGKIASTLSGGGHVASAGYTARGPMGQAVNSLLETTSSLAAELT